MGNTFCQTLCESKHQLPDYQYYYRPITPPPFFPRPKPPSPSPLQKSPDGGRSFGIVDDKPTNGAYMSKDGTVQVIGEFDRRMMSGYGECVVREEGKLSRYVGLFCENRFVEGTIIEVSRPEKEGEDE
jgi:hypothetical protein